MIPFIVIAVVAVAGYFYVRNHKAQVAKLLLEAKTDALLLEARVKALETQAIAAVKKL